jgi:hypothetical protein
MMMLRSITNQHAAAGDPCVGGEAYKQRQRSSRIEKGGGQEDTLILTAQISHLYLHRNLLL